MRSTPTQARVDVAALLRDEATVELAAWPEPGALQAGDRVIVEGLQKIKPGVPVTVVDAAAPQAAAYLGT